MRMKTKSAFALAGVLTLALASCAGDEGDVGGEGDDDGGNGGEAAIESVDSITIGLVPATDSATEAEEENAQALADQLSEALDGFPVEIFFADGYQGVIQGMQSGDVQLLMSGPVGMIQAEDEVGGTPILQSVRFGSDQYVTQWFTNDPDTYCLDEVVQDEDGYSFCNGIYDEEAGELAEYGPMGEDALELIEDGTPVAYVDEAPPPASTSRRPSSTSSAWRSMPSSPAATMRPCRRSTTTTSASAPPSTTPAATSRRRTRTWARSSWSSPGPARSRTTASSPPTNSTRRSCRPCRTPSCPSVKRSRSPMRTRH